MGYKLYKYVFSFFLFFVSVNTIAKPQLPAFFSDHMVLQQLSKPAIWGKAKKNSKVEVYCSWNKKTYTTRSDQHSNWKIQIETPAAGGPFEIIIKDDSVVKLQDILIGEVWLCSGQSNMEMAMKGFKDQPVLNSNDDILFSKNPHIRLFTVPRAAHAIPQDTIKKSNWNLATPETVSNFSATAYYYGKYLYELLHVPIGLVSISYGGSPVEAFMDARTLEAFPSVKIPAANEPSPTNRMATTLYNGMLKPFLGYGIKGCIWYQGETNYTRHQEYKALFEAFVKSLRVHVGQGDFPFYYAQIAPYKYVSSALLNSAYLREAQLKAQPNIPNSGMAVLLDIGEEHSIHPANKAIGGKRLAYLALAKTYNIKGFESESPILDSLLINQNVATIKFKSANGITSFGKPLTLFEIAGADKIFYPAKATLNAGKINITAKEVEVPNAVRYAFKDFVQAELFSIEGLPISSFRTDNW